MSSTEQNANRHARGAPRGGNAVTIIALVLALAALGLAGWAAFRPMNTTSAEEKYSATQQTDAKSATCKATDLVRKGVSLNTNLQSPGGEGDVTGSLAVAANARLSLTNGGLYLIQRLDPATPPELADAVKKFANTLLDIGAGATAGSPNTDPDQAARLRAADGENAKLVDLCK